MPGFSIGNSSEDGIYPDARIESHRAHRWQIFKLGPIDGRSLPLIYTKSLKLPDISFDEELVDGASITYQFAKMVKYDDITITFYDVDGLYEQLIEWQKKIWTPEEGLKPANEYMDTCAFMIGQVDADGPSYILTAHNTWPKKVDHSELSYDRSDIKLITMTLACSHITTSAS